MAYGETAYLESRGPDRLRARKQHCLVLLVVQADDCLVRVFPSRGQDVTFAGALQIEDQNIRHLVGQHPAGSSPRPGPYHLQARRLRQCHSHT
jgi:hypothetical protein